MRRTWIGAALAAALAGCVSRGGEAPPVGEAFAVALTPEMLAAPSVYAVLGFREQLGLSAEQVAAIDSIGVWLTRSNAPLLDTLNQRASRPARAGRPQSVGTWGMALLGRMGRNNGAAVSGVAALLTPEQRARACDLFAEQRRARAAGTGRPALARVFGSSPDTLRDPSRRWIWCTRSAAARSSP